MILVVKVFSITLVLTLLIILLHCISTHSEELCRYVCILCQHLPAIPAPTSNTCTCQQYQHLPTIPELANNTSTYQQYQNSPAIPAPASNTSQQYQHLPEIPCAICCSNCIALTASGSETRGWTHCTDAE